MGAFELIAAFLTSSGLQSIAGAVQIIALGFLLKQTAMLQRLTSELHRWHDQPDREHPGAMIWWATGLNDLTEVTSQLSGTVRAISVTQAEHLEAIRDLKKLGVENSKTVTELIEYSKRAIATREHLVG